MLRLFVRRLCSVTLANGTVLKGDFHPANRELLRKGVAILPDGRVYSGAFDDAKGFPLPGSQLEQDGDLYKGSFNERWQREGLGEAWLADGTHYKGTFLNDELVEGTVRLPNGSDEVVFHGTLEDESFKEGTLRQHDFVYSGSFAEGQPQGKGKLVFTAGGEQEGTFLRGKLHGSNCRMKLDSGFVYVGEFMDGRIRSGTLYTPTYTYEGEFNEHGRAHGEGHQTYLTSDPKLTFTGIWNNGALVRGMCFDEYGAPVDWQENHDLQAKVLGDVTQSDGEEKAAINGYMNSKLSEAAQMHRQMNQDYLEDATAVEKQTGRFPSKMDLGYESGPQRETEAVQLSSEKQMADVESSRSVFASRAREFDEVAEDLRASASLLTEINRNMAKVQFTRQLGAEQLASQRVDEQFERFMKSFNRPTSSSSSSRADAGGPKLNVDGNPTWKSFTSGE